MTAAANSSLLGFLSSGEAVGYQIERSLRFNSSDSAFCSRTPSSAGNRRTYTWSGWVKRAALGSGTYYLFTAVDGANVDILGFEADNLQWYNAYSGGVTSTDKFRDPSAWYHILFAVDSTQATDSNRVKLYVNGRQITAFNSSLWPSLNRDFAINNTVAHKIGQYFTTNSSDFYLADVFFIDGQALTPSSFTEVSATTGQLIPKAYTGTFGTNGFWLKFSDNSAATATTLGKDYSGSSNNWTPNNLSVTAGAGNDSLVDTPTSYGTDTGAGGEVRGNYCTLNPIDRLTTATLSNGNLEFTTATTGHNAIGTIGMVSGKWYWEASTTAGTTQARATVYGASASSYYSFAANNTVYGFRFDADSGVLEYTTNGSSWTSLATGLTSGPYFPYFNNNGTTSKTIIANFGQRPFAYTAPSGFKALCDTNLPAPVVAKPNTVMDVALYTGNGTSKSVTGLNFSPEFVWIKSRSAVTNNVLFDAVRGAAKILYSDLTSAEVDRGNIIYDFTSFDSNGFTVGISNNAGVNTNNATYAAWCFDAGSNTVSNTAGSITSQVRANASAGFSIVTYSGNSSTATVGHGLNVAPSWIIIKNRTSAYDWIVYANESGTLKQLYLNLTLNASSSGLSLPSSTTFNLPGGGASGSNETGKNYVAYCFAPVAGYSAFGSYTGNNSADGPFQWCGFRPRWLLIKSVGYAADWIIIDAARETYNVMQKALFPNRDYYEAQASTALRVDFLSNGFKIRSTDGNAEGWNYPSNSHVWAAFAENPFQYARAR